VVTPWVTEEEKDYVERCSTFYFPIAYPDQRVLRHAGAGMARMPFSVMRRLAAARVARNAYNLPVEWRMAKLAARALGKSHPFQISQFYS
jgi:hypothetical protein